MGTQKEKIDSMVTNKCPSGCGMIEDNGHCYLHCQHKTMAKERQRLQGDLLKQMDKINTHPGIKSTIIKLINTILWDPDAQDKPTTPDEYLILKAATEQDLLENKALEKGYISNDGKKHK